MSEADSALKGSAPNTVSSLVADLQAAGLMPGSTVLVHSSLSALGWVAGGAQAVIEALLLALGKEGTLVMPAHSSHLSDPGDWQNPAVPEDWWPTIREEMSPYDPARTPTRGIGAISEAFRTWPGVIRSAHPTGSFAASGPAASRIVKDHSLNDPFGENSPLARLYDADGFVLLLGVGHASNTSLHLAEYRADWPGKRTVSCGSPVLVSGARQWTTYTDVDTDSDDFDQIGEAFATTRGQVAGRIGASESLMMRQRALVDFAVSWMQSNRGVSGV